MFKEKYIRPTRKEEGHTEIYWNDEYIGYIIQNRSPYRTVGENWMFTSKSDMIDSLNETNRSKLISTIKSKMSDYHG